MKDMIKMTASIVLFATVACVGLAFVFSSTKDRIDENKAATLKQALEKVFPGSEFEKVTDIGESADDGVQIGENTFIARSGGRISGIAVNASCMGFNDTVEAIVGVGVNGEIAGLRILKNTDTPGLGANASSETYFIDKPARTKTFFGQFSGMKTSGSIKVSKDGGDVVAITAATITSRAVSRLVEAAAKTGGAYLAKKGGAN